MNEPANRRPPISGFGSDLKMAHPTEHLTNLLQKAGEGQGAAREALFPLVSEHLFRLAERVFSKERPGHTLEVTAIVNDAFMELVDSRVTWNGRRQFFAIAGVAMSRILTRYARQRDRLKRGGDRMRVTLEHHHLLGEEGDIDLLDLADALERLRTRYPRMADIVEQRFFCGLTVAETADVLNLGVRTVEKDWRFARAWLWRELDGTDES